MHVTFCDYRISYRETCFCLETSANSSRVTKLFDPLFQISFGLTDLHYVRHKWIR